MEAREFIHVRLHEKRKYIATCEKNGVYNNFAPGLKDVTHYDVFIEDGKLFAEYQPTGTIQRYCYNPPASQSEQQTIANVIERCKFDKRWTVIPMNV